MIHLDTSFLIVALARGSRQDRKLREWLRAGEPLGMSAIAWAHAERGEAVETYEGVGFESMAQLLATLTPKRWELLERLKQEGPMTVYALAKSLGRDYKNVHTDVKALSELDIVQRTKEGKIMVPWDEIEARLRLAA